MAQFIQIYRVGQKCGTWLLSISSPIIDWFSKFFHWHTHQTICNNTIITYPTTPQMCFYTTLWNINEICIHNANNKRFGKIKKTLQTNIAVKVCMSLDCVDLTQASVIQMIYRNVGLKCFFIHLIFCNQC